MDGPALFQANLLSLQRATKRADLHPTIHRPSDALVSSALIIFAFAAVHHPIPFPSNDDGGVEYFASNYGPLMN